jgi:hypothetical protein
MEWFDSVKGPKSFLGFYKIQPVEAMINQLLGLYL